MEFKSFKGARALKHGYLIKYEVSPAADGGLYTLSVEIYKYSKLIHKEAQPGFKTEKQALRAVDVVINVVEKLEEE